MSRLLVKDIDETRLRSSLEYKYIGRLKKKYTIDVKELRNSIKEEILLLDQSLAEHIAEVPTIPFAQLKESCESLEQYRTSYNGTCTKDIQKKLASALNILKKQDKPFSMYDIVELQPTLKNQTVKKNLKELIDEDILTIAVRGVGQGMKTMYRFV